MDDDHTQIPPASEGAYPTGEIRDAFGTKETSGERSVTLRVGQVDETWAAYGLRQMPLLVRHDEEYQPSNYKLITRGDAVRPDLVAIVSRGYELFPNEELAKVMATWAQRNGYRRYEDARYSFVGSGGHAVFLAYLPEDEKAGSYYVTKGDLVRVGFCARNSIDASVGFGLDVFTYRGTCWNGSIVTSKEGQRAWTAKDLGKAAEANLSHRHTVGLRGLIEGLNAHVEELRHIGESVITYYKRLAQERLSQKIADALAHTIIPAKCLPWETGKNKQPIVDTRKTLWDTYNSLTQAIWHNAKTDMRTKWLYFGALHQTLTREVPAR